MYPTIDNAIMTALKNNDAITYFVGSDIFPLVAPIETSLPYITFKQITGGFEFTSPRPEFDVTYRIDYVSDVRELAEQGAKVIYETLHGQTIDIEGWDNYDIAAGGFYLLVDVDKDTPIYRSGGMYRIRADQKAGV